MASSPCLKTDDLIAPIPGENPAGPSVPFAIRQKLEEARKEIRLEDYPANDPMRPEQAKYADWPLIIRVGQETLTATSKDLMVAARMTEALVKVHGFAGLRDGLQLLRRLFEECWDRLNPTIEDGDLEVRGAPLNWLDDPDKGARFPSSLRAVPLISHQDTDIGWLAWRKGQDGNDESRQLFEKAVSSTPRERCQDVVDDLTVALNELTLLKAISETRMGEHAVGLLEIGNAINDCLTLAQQILGRKGQAPVAAAPAEEDEEETVANNGKSGPPRMNTREEVYEQLASAAAILQQIEPHSPIPYLIQRAVEMGRLPFPDLIKVLVRDQNILKELNRELGIKEPGK